MSVRTLLIVVLALVCGVSAVMLFSTFRQAPAAANPDLVPVVVAATDVTRGTLLSKELIKIEDRHKDAVPEGAITSIEEALERVVSSPLAKKEPVLRSRLYPKGAVGGLEAMIPKGMQAMAIQTPNVASGVAGLLFPGNRVDVLWTLPQGSTGRGPVTTTLLRNVEILAVDQRVERPTDSRYDGKEMRSVTLVVTPNQANRLALAQTLGTLHLSLRNPADNPASETAQVSFEDLFPEKAKEVKEEKPPPATPVAVERAPDPPPEPQTIRTLRGTLEGEVKLTTPAGR